MADRDRISTLGHFAELFAASSDPGVAALAEAPFATQLTLRVRPGSPVAAAVAELLGGPLPTEPNTAWCGPGLDVLWLGPDEWLVVAPEQAAVDLEPALAGTGATVVDVSAQRTIVELTGSAAADVLAKGCALDLHPAAFGPGRCAQTALARAHVILQARAGGFRIFVRASFADYLAEWLIDASLEERIAARSGDVAHAVAA